MADARGLATPIANLLGQPELDVVLIRALQTWWCLVQDLDGLDMRTNTSGTHIVQGPRPEDSIAGLTDLQDFILVHGLQAAATAATGFSCHSR